LVRQRRVLCLGHSWGKSDAHSGMINAPIRSISIYCYFASSASFCFGHAFAIEASLAHHNQLRLAVQIQLRNLADRIEDYCRLNY
jgi:hypothetical protein